MKVQNSLKLRKGNSTIVSQGTVADRRSRSSAESAADRARELARESLMEVIFTNAPVGILVCDAGGQITVVNTLARKLAQSEPRGKPVDVFSSIWGEMFEFDGRHVPIPEWPSTKAMQGEITKAKTFHMVRYDRSHYDALMSASPIRSSGSHVAGAIMTLIEVSEHRRKELILREEAIRKERNRMAADIHDNLSQGLNAVVLQLDAAEHSFREDLAQAQRRVTLALALARQNLREARRSMWVLSHDGFENEDLAAAIHFLAERLFEGTGVELELSFQDETHPMSPKLKRELLLIAKEAMANSLKHAQGTKVRVELSSDMHAVHLSVSDNGHGFLLAPVPGIHRGYGLFSMHTRAESIAGTLAIDTHLGRGTSVTVRVPLSREASSRPAKRS